jgi:putative NADPH-quinone reductase
MPRDVREQQAKVAAADALVFIAPVYFVGYPAILKGWVERVFTLGFAFELSAEGWAGDVGGRIPLLKHDKALIINTTIFDQKSYDAGIGEAMGRLMDDWCLRFPGVKDVQHVYFHAVHDGDMEVTPPAEASDGQGVLTGRYDPESERASGSAVLHVMSGYTIKRSWLSELMSGYTI